MNYSSTCFLNQKPCKIEIDAESSLKVLFVLIFGFMFCVAANKVVLAEEGLEGYSVNRPLFRKQTYENSARQGLEAPKLHTNSDSNSVECGVVLLDFYNDECGPCRSMMPAVNSLVKRGYRVSKVNTDRFPDWASRFHITKIPCFVVIVDGKEVSRHVGVTSESKLENLIVQAGGSPVQLQRRVRPEGSSHATQVAESAWRGRETKLSVQEIVAGNYVFQNEVTPGIPQSQNVAGNSSWQTVQTIPAAPSVGADGNSAFTRVSNESQMTSNPAPQNVSNSHNPASITSRVLSSTVRIHVNDVQNGAMSEGTGTGTLIDCRSGHALVLTCGHLFHEYKRGDVIKVEIFTEQGILEVPGRYVNHDEERDLGLISLTVDRPIVISQVAEREFRLQKGMPVTTAGCSYGAEPTIQTGVITNLNRFLGTPNIEVSAVPVQGRSGGGMFSEDGKLLGVCFAANPDDQEGIYTSVEGIHDYFRSLKMEQFVLSPRNESLSRPMRGEVEVALNDLPKSRKSIVKGELKQAEPETVSLANSNTVEPITPSSARLMPVSREQSLTGATSPEWPPKWKE